MDAWTCMHRYSVDGKSDDIWAIHGIVDTCSTSA